MTSEELKKHIEAAQVAKSLNEAISRRAYFDGKHPGIYHDSPKESPDNRVPVPIVRKAVKLVLGYAFRPGSVVYSGTSYESTLKDIFDSNEETLLTPELAECALIHSRAFELHWTEDGISRFAQVPIGQAIPIYDNSLVPKIIGFIRRWMDETGTQHAESYDDRTKQTWDLLRDGWQMVDEVDHGYKAVPIVEYTISGDNSNLFDHVLPLVDLMDQSMSEDVANELQRFASAYLLLADDINGTDTDDNGETELDKVRRTKAFTRLGEGVRNKVDFLTRQFDPTFINTALDRIERLIYDMLSVPNPADDVFAAETGIAIEYKLQPFEYLVSTICAYFTKGLQQRIRLILNLDGTINGTLGDSSEVAIKFNRNKPDDISSIADNMIKLDSFLSRETLLKMLPATIVPDVEEELAKVGEEVEEFDAQEEPQVQQEEMIEGDDAPEA